MSELTTFITRITSTLPTYIRQYTLKYLEKPHSLIHFAFLFCRLEDAKIAFHNVLFIG